MHDDASLLRTYAASRDEAAFAELVRRHIDAVYSIALRRAGYDTHLAEDIVQQVFLSVARDARRLADHPVLTGWLHTATRYAAANAVRQERRRKNREQQAQAMNQEPVSSTPDADWPQVARVLDGAIDRLDESDRVAVLLRFIDRRSFAEIGATLGVTEDTARKRVERALEKLRLVLSRRGVVSTAAALGVALAQNAVGVAPAGLATTVTAMALAGGSVASGILGFMSMMKLPAGIAAVILAGTGVVWNQLRVGEVRAAGSTNVSTPSIDSAPQQAVAKMAVHPKPNPTAPRATAAPPAATLQQVTVEARVARLDTLVRLTAEQKAKVAEIFFREVTALEAFAVGEERATKGTELRQTSRTEVRAILTPEQRRKYDVSPQSLGGGLRTDPAYLVARLDQVVTLSVEQKQKVYEIFWDDIVDQLSALPSDEQLPGFRWNDKVRDRLRTVLTPEQTATFDTTAPYKKNQSAKGS